MSSAGRTVQSAERAGHGRLNQAGHRRNNARQRRKTPRPPAARRPAAYRKYRRDATTNYELDRTIRHTQQKPAPMQRLSVAVVVNYLGTDKDGKPQPMSKEQLAQIEALVREAMGYQQPWRYPERGQHAVYRQSGDRWRTAVLAKPVVYRSSARRGPPSAGAAGGLLWRKLVRPQLQQRRGNRPPPPNAPAAKPVDSSKPSNEELAQRRKSQQRVSAEVQSQRIRDLADKDPRVVALVIRQWMSNEI